MTKLLVCVSFLISSVLISTFVIKDCIARKYHSDYKKVLKGKGRNTEKQKYYLEKSLEFSSSNADTLFELGEFYMKKKFIDKSIEDRNRSYELAMGFFNDALSCKPTDGNKYAQYAWCIGDNGNVHEAIEYFEKAIKLGKTRAYIHRLYATWCVNLVKRTVGLRNTHQFANAYNNDQVKAEILKSYDEKYISGVSVTVLLEKAQTEWKKVLSLSPSRDQATYNSLADLSLLRCEIDKAFFTYKSTGNKIMLVRCYLIKGNYYEAVSLLGAIIKGDTKFFKKFRIQTKNLLKEVISRDPKNYLAFNWLGEMYARLGKNKQAILNFKKTVELNPKYTDAHLQLGKLYKMTGKSELAIYEFETVLSLVTNHKEATLLLGELIRENYKDAEFMIK